MRAGIDQLKWSRPLACGLAAAACLFHCLPVVGESLPAQPGKIVTRYALTSSQDVTANSPAAWRLFGSNDGGGSWVLLDTRTNQIFAARGQRRSFRIQNQTAYRSYRLQVDEPAWPVKDATAADRVMQLAELELIGQTVGTNGLGALQSVISASKPHPTRGRAESAFDGDPRTSWMDFGVAGDSTNCWIQCDYVADAERTVTNLQQLHLLARLAASQDWVAERGPRIISNLNHQASRPARVLSGYALTSANDSPGRDPRDWRLLGSSDGGKHWLTLDQRRNEVFADRFQRRVFSLTNEQAFSLYRLEIQAVRALGDITQVSEIEPIYPRGGPDSALSLLVLACADNPPLESTEAAFDGDTETKWLSFIAPSTNRPVWIQWEYLPAERDLPVINRYLLDQLAERWHQARLLAQTPPLRVLQSYSLTSADDEPPRDPRDWQLLGSKDQGKTWVMLDHRQQEHFSGRFQKKSFKVGNPEACSSYRLQIDSVADPSKANAVQIGELAASFAGVEPSPRLSVVVSARGENPPFEGADKIFDGDTHSKWLDFADGQTNRNSWIQWQYAAGEELPVVNLDHRPTEEAESASGMRLQAEGVIVSWDPEARLLGLLDESGCEQIELASLPAAKFLPGARVRISGRLDFLQQSARLTNAAMEVLGRVPEAGLAGRDGAAASRDAFWQGSAVGRVTAISQDRFYTTLRLSETGGKGALLARVMGTGRVRLPSPADCRLEVHGVMEPVFGTDGERTPGVIWVADWASVALANPTEKEWESIPEVGLDSLCLTNRLPRQLVRVQGLSRPSLPDGNILLSQGDAKVVVCLPRPLSEPEGTRLEAVGLPEREGSQVVLRLAHARALRPQTAARTAPTASSFTAENPATQLGQVLQLIKTQRSNDVPVRVRGILTYIDLDLSDFYLQNGDEAITISDQANAGLSPLLHQEGAYIEVRGVVRGGALRVTDFAQFLGRGTMPPPARHSWDFLMTGQDDGKWVELEGVVRAVERQRVTLNVAGGEAVLLVKELHPDLQRRLLGSLVRAEGVCVPVLNNRRQRLGIRLLVPFGECLQLVSAVPENPFDVPAVLIGQILQNGREAKDQQAPLTRTEGIVTYREPRLIFLQQGEDGLRVFLRQEASVEPGDRVEVVGFAEPDGFSPKLVQALVRKVGTTNLPAATPIELMDSEGHSREESRDATRGTIEGRLLGSAWSESRHVLELEQDLTRHPFRVYLPASKEDHFPLEKGSRLRVEGVFKAGSEAAPDFGPASPSFEMFVNSLQDIRILQQPPWWTALHTLWTLGGLAVVLLLSLGWSALLRTQVRERTEALRAEIEGHKETEAKLEAEIAERKRMQGQVEKTHHELLAASRRAGMAEVATGVLHNVGNVLNSVNVSATLLRDKLKQSKLANLGKAVALLQDRGAGMGEFLTLDPKGKQLPGYLAKLNDHLVAEEAASLDELEKLNEHVEHIKDIIIVQQSYASVAGVTERIHVADLVEDALRMNDAALARHGVELVREYGPDLPELALDKHKALQILINLISNARHACDQAGISEKRLVVRTTRAGPVVQITFEDNGVGIPPENLTRIFNHGFTTRKDGHGFGLHSGALAAKEMGGRLYAASEGTGKGATFTLELPVGTTVL